MRARSRVRFGTTGRRPAKERALTLSTRSVRPGGIIKANDLHRAGLAALADPAATVVETADDVK